MNKMYTLLVVAITFCSCEKNITQPDVIPAPTVELDYTNLSDKMVKMYQPAISIDLNKDGIKDIAFGVRLVGDPLLQQDKDQFMVTSGIETNLFANDSEETPVLAKNSLIPIGNTNGYYWYNASSIMLVQKITGYTNSYWDGNWKGAVKQYLPVQVIKNNLKYNGWVELTVDTSNAAIILHRAAISKQAEVAVVAGV